MDAPGTDWALHVADLTAEPDPHAAALAWMARDTARPVDLERDPLFGHALLRVAPEEYLWYHRVHHIALDGFGLSLVARRVARVYTALVEGAPPGGSGYGTLESVRREEEAYRASERFAEDRAYWVRRFADRPPVASLTTGQACPPAPSCGAPSTWAPTRRDGCAPSPGRSRRPGPTSCWPPPPPTSTG